MGASLGVPTHGTALDSTVHTGREQKVVAWFAGEASSAVNVIAYMADFAVLAVFALLAVISAVVASLRSLNFYFPGFITKNAFAFLQVERVKAASAAILSQANCAVVGANLANHYSIVVCTANLA